MNKDGSPDKSDKSDSSSDEIGEEAVLTNIQLDVKIEFDEEKEKILSSLSKDHKDKLGTIGFSKWGKRWLPVLVRGPYDVGPGSVRRQWFGYYKTMNATDRMPYLVYWYGSKKSDDYYSFVLKQNFIALDETEKLKKHNLSLYLPPNIQEKIRKGERLTPLEDDTVRAYREVEEDLLKKPEDRKRGDIDFPESWQLLTMQDVRDLGPGDDNSIISELGVKKKPTKKKGRKPGPKPKQRELADDNKHEDKASKKRKRVKVDQNDEGSVSGQPKPKPKKRARKSESIESELDDRPKPATAVKKRRKLKATKVQHDDHSEASDTNVLSKKRRKLNPTKVKKHTKEDANGLGTLQPTQEEKTLKQCQQAFLPAIERWKSLVKDNDISLLVQHLENTVQNQLNSYSSLFISKFGIQDLARQTKALFGEISSDDNTAETAKSMDAMLDGILKVVVDSSSDKKSSRKKGKESVMVADFVKVEVKEEAEEDLVVSEEVENVKRKKKPITDKRQKKGEGKNKKTTMKKEKSVKHRPQSAKDRKRRYNTLVNDWKAALSSKDVIVVYQSINEMRKGAKEFQIDDEFFAEMGLLVKATKDLLKEDHGKVSCPEDAKSCLKDLKQTLKELYIASTNEKRAVPRKADVPSKVVAPSSAEDIGLDVSERINDLKPVKVNTKDDETTVSIDKVKNVVTGDETIEQSTEKLPLKPESSITNTNTEVENVTKSPLRQKSLPAVNSASHKSGGKKFLTLGSMIRTDSKPAVAEIEPEIQVPDKSSSMAPETKVGPKQVPSWVSAAADVLPPSHDQRRQNALLFFQETRVFFGSADFNFESVCLSIEAAVFEWANASFPVSEWENQYWAKVHAIVAAVSSQPTREGSLVKQILEGQVVEARDILTFDFESATDPFEKSPLVPSSIEN